jgi:hypothetical protein
MAPVRRTLLRAVGTTILLGLAGCLAALRSGQVGVRIDNRDDRTHVVDVEFLDGGELVAEERFEVAAETGRGDENVAAAGEYTVDVTLDGATHTTIPFSMNGCTDNTLFVAVDADADADATVEADVLDEC